jgi:hypothetical protein
MNFKLLKKVLIAIFPCLIVAGVLFFFFHPRTVEIKSEKNGWQILEEPEFQLEGVKKGAKIKVFLIDPKGKVLSLEEGKDFEIRSGSPTKIKILRNGDKLMPGLYKIKIEIEENGKTETLEKTFPWGVLAINTNKSIYLPGETAYLQMAALGDDGHTICNANLKLKIKNEKLKIEDELSTAGGRIQRSRECGPDNVTDKPDYFAFYQVREPGVYKITLTNLDNGYEIEDSFEVRKSVPFDVERIGPTRIWPKAPYEMTLKIKANQDFKGKIVETVPKDFSIVECQNCSPLEKPVQDFKEWAFNIEMKKGESYELKYKFDAPDVSPYLYLLGPLSFTENGSREAVFQETRHWQVAADAPDTLILRPNATGTYQQWSTFGDTVHWSLTSDQNDNTGVQVTGTTTLKETENLADTTQAGTINSVTAYMRAKASSSTETYTLYAHQETVTIGGTSYYLLKTTSADAAGTTLSTSSGATTETLRRLFGKFVFQLSDVVSIPASTWTIYYRQYYSVGGGGNFFSGHYDVDILIRKSDGTIRTTIATDVATSSALTTSWSTATGTYAFPGYTVVDPTDYLEIDFYVHENSKKVTFYFRFDDQTLNLTDQTRAEGVSLDYSEKAVIVWRTHSTDYESSATTVSRTAFTDYSETRTVNPYTGSAWTWDEINNLEIGARATQLGSADTIQVSEFWIVVDYTPPITVSGYAYENDGTTSWSGCDGVTKNIALVISTSYYYRRPITITNTTSSLTDYQVLVTLDTQSLISAGKMRSDCGDIRFTDTDGVTYLNYWLESGCNTASTKIWVKVPSIPASSSKTIYIYYGNPSATSLSNGDATFILFDDFTIKDTSKWDFWEDANNPISVSNGILSMKASAAGGNLPSARSKISFNNSNISIEFLWKFDAPGPVTGWNYINNLVAITSSDYVNIFNRYYYSYDEVWRDNKIGGTSNAARLLGGGQDIVWHTYWIRYSSSNCEIYVDGTLIQTITPTFGTVQIHLGSFYGSTTTATSYDDYGYWDWIKVRKYTSPEPTTSVGGEENAGAITFATATTTCSTSTGAFQFSNVISPATSTPMVIYFKGVSGNYGSNVNRYSGSGDVTGIVVRKNAVILQHDDSGPITNADLNSWDNDNDSDVNYVVTNGNLTVESGSKLIINSNDTFTPGGTVTIENGDLLMMSSSTLTANNSVTVNGDLSISSGATLNGTSSVTVNGGDATGEGTINLTGGTFTLDGAGYFGGNSNWTFYNLTFGGDSNVETTVATGTGEITLSNVLTIGQNQTLNAGSKKWKLLGLGTPFVINGNFNASSSTFTYIGQSGWRYRKSVTISNSTSSLTDYQVLVTLDTLSLISAGKMQSDCDDIRFTDSDGQTLLNFWLDSGCNTTSTQLWVKVPSIPANSTKTIYVYYGNPSATSASNGRNTFNVFEDMSVTPLGTLKNNAYYDSTNKWVRLTTASGSINGELEYTTSQIGLNVGDSFVATFEFWAGGGSGADATWLYVYNTVTPTTEDDGAGGYHFVYDEYNDQIQFKYNGSNLITSTETTIDNSQWHKAKIIYHNYKGIMYYDETERINYQDSTRSLTGTLFGWGARTGGSTNEHRIRNLIVRKYTSPEPTTSVGGEEALSLYVNISAATYNNLEILPQIDGFPFIFGTGTGQTIATNGYFTIGNGTNTVTTTADTYDPILDINGDFTISSNATFIASNSSLAYFAKNWTNNGTFVHSTGTIVFDGSDTSTLSGATTFYNFTCTTPNKVLQFPAGTSSTTTIQGTLTLNGGDCSTQIKLRSSTDGSQWYINALATSSINYVDVKDSYAITPLTAYYSTDSGNNTNWTIYPCVAVGAIRIKGCTKLEGGVRLK